ncbi:zinc-dependent metalloprotease [Gracilimonas mengyeensis]|uniref:Por secretion system C-terminal sorting domain-containing protein n=1 Tax=Gracilimonas mengyeensis TaxID=1302730 RepID=A0A521CWT7_9BACT|nr:zinc-dependent metalloprotease [Gracilimonas mengyeensis]SMO63878.1 Por secretion system C-terminal sorting domain-containing protein [Gracilimonas mengyeensis]
MRNITFCLLIIAVFLSTATPTIAQQQVFQLNTLQPETNSLAAKTDRQFFKLNGNVFSNPEFKKGAEFTFDTGEDEPTRFVVTRHTEYLPGTVSIIARKADGNNRVFTATYANGRLLGNYHTENHRSVSISFDAQAGQHYLSRGKVAQEKELSCGLYGREHEFVAWPDRPDQKRSWAKTSGSTYQYKPSSLTSSIEDSTTIDLMLVYTNNAASWASDSSSFGSIDVILSQAMNRSQTALDNSQLGIELRLVHVYKTSYDEINDGVESNELLKRLTQNPDNPVYGSDEGYDGYLEEVHDLRQEYGADLVAMIAQIWDVGGLGWRLGSTSGDPVRGFSVNRVQQIATGYTLIHEIGHNMGNSHARTQRESAADTTGGLFHYSVGYQDKDAGIHTIMAYRNSADNIRLEEVPIFSSPDLEWEGVTLGTNNNITPENNALSMAQIKRTVANYQLSVVDPPVAQTSTDEIALTLNREDDFTVVYNLSNSGASNLMWEVDFDFPGNILSKQKAKSSGQKLVSTEPAELQDPVRYPANLAPFAGSAKSSQRQEEVIYETSFEGSEGFAPGSYSAISDWRLGNNSEFLISSANANSGNQHLRLEYDGNTYTNNDGEEVPSIQFVSAPFFGYQPFGNYEVIINFEIGGTGYINETFDFYLMDGQTGNFSSGVIISNSDFGYTLFAADLDETGALTWLSNGSANPTSGRYHTLRILYNADEEQIEYFLNGSRFYTASYLNGKTPGEMQVLHRNSVAGTYMNIDDIEIRRLNAPTEWLSVPDPSGITGENGSSSINLNFNTRGVSAGTYETLMTVATNDPINPLIEVPVQLTVNNTVSSELEERPQKFELNQNYPNPFNPTTVISYQLAVSSDVQLEVFDMAGRKVATLVNERQNAGQHRVNFDGANLASGIYMYRLNTPNQTVTRQMVLIK